MNDKNPIYYDDYKPGKWDEILEDFEEEFGKSVYSCHEIHSEYVHTDIAVFQPDDDNRTIVTLGMGARETASPLPDFRRVELMLMGTPRDNDPDEETIIACAELQNLSKYPFRNDTWFGPGHTINVSKKFKDAFGYSFLFFVQYPRGLQVDDVGNVSFLLGIPIYDDEREWIATHKNGSQHFLDQYMKEVFETEAGLLFDVERPHIMPKG